MLALLLLACGGDPVDLTVMEGFGYRWNTFNHRLSYLEGGVSEGEVDLAVVGGTSTTGVAPELDESCDAETCDEFPFTDVAAVSLGWGQLRAKRVGSGVAEITLLVDAAGAVSTAQVPLDDPEDAVVAVLGGLVLDTDHALPDDVPLCYDPAYGWHPRQIAVSLGAPVPGDGVAEVEVRAAFSAGNSLEAERACVDAVNEYATVALTVRVVVLSGRLDATAQALDQSASYAYGSRGTPEEQPDPDPASRPLNGDPAESVFGWSALDFRFHVDDPDDRGAYLRSLSFLADAFAGSAIGHATNYSPGTQLSAFDYAFTGTVVAVSAEDGEITRGTVAAELPAELDDNGSPVITTVPLE